MSTARALAACLVAAFAGCAGEAPIDPPSDLHVARRGIPERATLGAPLDVVVTRVWRDGAAPAAFDPASLQPLAVDRSDVVRRGDGAHVEETWTLRARALSVGRIEVSAPTLRVGERLARGEPDVVTVVSGLPEDDDGRAELPDDVLAVPAPQGRRLAVAAALAVAVWLAVRLRRRVPPAPARAPGPPPRDLRGRLQALRAATPTTDAEWDGFARDVAEVVREAADAVPPQTSEEVAARAGSPAVGAALATCDAVRYGAGRPDPGRLVDCALDAVGSAP